MADINLDRLLKPASIAIVGASTRPESYGCMVLDMLLEHEFPGPIYPVNPKREEIRGLVCYPSLASIPAPVDLVYLALPSSLGPEVMEEAARIGAGGAVVPGNGYADGGADGQALQRRLVEAAAKNSIAICGPNNMGFINYNDRVAAWPTPVPPIERLGKVALVSHSGSVGIALSQDGRQLDFAYVISAGNEANVTAADYLRYCVADDNVEVVLLFLETVRDPAGFARAAVEARKRGKHVAVVKVGRSQTASRMVAAHTGAVAGQDELYDAYFRRLGVLRVPDLDTLIEAGAFLLTGPKPPPAPGLTLVTVSGGEGALAADLCGDLGIEVPALDADTVDALRAFFPAFATPRNPIDAYGFGWNRANFEQIMRVLAAGAPAGSIAICTDSAAADEAADDGLVTDMAEVCTAIEPATSKLLLYVNNSAASGISPRAREAFTAAGIPALLGLGESLTVLARWMRLGQTDPATSRPAPNAELCACVAEPLGEAQRLQLLAANGISMVGTEVVSTPREAADAAERADGSVVLKGTAPELLHKTEHQLVALDLRTPEAAAAAFERLDKALKRSGVPLERAEVLVQPMLEDGVELLLGATYHPGFGTLIATGVGGTLVEVVGRASVELAPVSRERAAAMLNETPAGKLIRGTRGRGPYDFEAASNAIVRFSEFALAVEGALKAIEINPLLVLPAGRGVAGLDAVFER